MSTIDLPEIPEVNIIEAKSASRLPQRWYESKVRRVRTPEGADKYGQPIGSIIVTDPVHIRKGKRVGKLIDRANVLSQAAKPKSGNGRKRRPAGTSHLFAAEQEFEDWDTVVDERGRKFYIGKENAKTWVATDDQDRVVAEGPTRSEALHRLDGFVAPKKREIKRGEDGIPLSMHKASDAERKKYKIPPAWTDVAVTDNPDNPVGGLVAVGKDGTGKEQKVYTAEHEAKQAAKKYNRIMTFARYVEGLNAATKRDAKKNPTAAVALIIQRTGMRPGSKAAAMKKAKPGAKTGNPAYGATTLQARHVNVTDSGTVIFDFQSKSNKVTHLVVKNDPILAAAMKSHLKGKRGKDFLFNTTPGKVHQYMHNEGGIPQGFIVKDLRTLHANIIALDMVNKRKRKPKSKTELKRWTNEVGDAVSKALGNTRKVALDSYISPVVFGKWQSAVEGK